MFVLLFETLGDVLVLRFVSCFGVGGSCRGRERDTSEALLVYLNTCVTGLSFFQ